MHAKMVTHVTLPQAQLGHGRLAVPSENGHYRPQVLQDVAPPTVKLESIVAKEESTTALSASSVSQAPQFNKSAQLGHTELLLVA